jgi:predicted metal-dependent hydrolase
MKSPLPIIIRRHPSAKRMTLRLSPDGSEIRLTLPKRTLERTGMAFVEQQHDWIATQRKNHSARKTIRFKPEVVIPLFGKDCELQHDAERRGMQYCTLATYLKHQTEREALVPAQAGSEARSVGESEARGSIPPQNNCG